MCGGYALGRWGQIQGEELESNQNLWGERWLSLGPRRSSRKGDKCLGCKYILKAEPIENITENFYNTLFQFLRHRELLEMIRETFDWATKILKLPKESWELTIKVSISSLQTASILKEITEKEDLVILWRIEGTNIKYWFGGS